MAFDPLSGNLWDQENGEDAFDEINLVEPGMNSGWIQVMGPSSRVAQYKQIETTSLHHEDFPNLQQFRWGPERIADTPAEALVAALRAAGLPLQRSGVQLEARAGSRGDRIPQQPGARTAVVRGPLRRASRSTTIRSEAV